MIQPDQMGQRQAEQVFVEGAGLLRIAASIGVVVEPFDVHGFDASPRLCDPALVKDMKAFLGAPVTPREKRDGHPEDWC